jgi:hypothetical protein
MQAGDRGGDVITKTPAAEGQAVLAVAVRNIFEFLYVMPPRPVISIF